MKGEKKEETQEGQVFVHSVFDILGLTNQMEKLFLEHGNDKHDSSSCYKSCVLNNQLYNSTLIGFYLEWVQFWQLKGKEQEFNFR